jgi:hypothetical protein
MNGCLGQTGQHVTIEVTETLLLEVYELWNFDGLTGVDDSVFSAGHKLFFHVLRRLDYRLRINYSLGHF